MNEHRLCKCGHDVRRHAHHPIDNSSECTGAVIRNAPRCTCSSFRPINSHSTQTKKHISALRNAARTQRGKPLQMPLFNKDTAAPATKPRDPHNPLAAHKRRATP